MRELKAKLSYRTDAEFARFLGIKPQTLASWYARNTFDIDLIYSKCKDVNPHWLLTGEGEILKEEEFKSGRFKDYLPPYGPRVPEGAIPFYNVPASSENTIDAIEEKKDPDGYVLNLPGIVYTKAFLPVFGYSMPPEVKEGAIIGINTVEKGTWEHLNTQHKYLIITQHDRMINYIRHDRSAPDILWCSSPNYDDFTIPKKDIAHIHKITLVINPE